MFSGLVAAFLLVVAILVPLLLVHLNGMAPLLVTAAFLVIVIAEAVRSDA